MSIGTRKLKESTNTRKYIKFYIKVVSDEILAKILCKKCVILIEKKTTFIVKSQSC